MEDPSQTEETPNPPTQTMSLSGRLMNVFAAPGEVFEAIKRGRPATSNWLVPVLLACVVGVIHVWVMFSQPAIQQQMRTQQAAQFERLVEEGTMTAEQAEQAQTQMGDTPILIAKVAGSFGAVFFSFVWLFGLSLVLWLLARWVFKARFNYIRTVEMVGLSTMIGVLGGIVTLLVVVATGNMFMTPSPALFLQDFDPKNKAHLLLSSLNLVTLWYVGVLSIGLSKLTGRSFAMAALWLYGVWAVLRVAMIASGLGGAGM